MYLLTDHSMDADGTSVKLRVQNGYPFTIFGIQYAYTGIEGTIDGTLEIYGTLNNADADNFKTLLHSFTITQAEALDETDGCPLIVNLSGMFDAVWVEYTANSITAGTLNIVGNFMIGG